MNILKLSISSLLLIIIISVFGYLYFSDHAWGAWGDDSAGYIFLAGRMWQKKPLIWQDDLAKKAYDYFASPKLIQFILPTHHELINPNGFIASKYPLGLSVLMYLGAKIFRTDLAFYYIEPFFAVLNLVLIYLLFLLLFRRQFLAFFAAIILGIAELYYGQAIAQPMREIPSITFFLLTVYLLVLYFKNDRWWLLALAGLSFGYAANIRETMITLVPAVLALFISQKHWFKRGIIFSLFTLLALSLTFWNSFWFSKFNLPMRARDTDIVITSNIGHLRSISFQNIFDNQGRFLPGVGSLSQFWKVMNNFSPWPMLMVFVVLGLVFLWLNHRRFFWFFLLWIIGVLGFFSLWINPYPRYILPIYPALATLTILGVYLLVQNIIPHFFKHKIIISIIIIISFIFSYQSTLALIKNNLQEEIIWDRAIGFSDLQQLKDLGKKLEGKVLIMNSRYQYGLSETYMAHTGERAIKLPKEKNLMADPQKNAEFFKQLLKQGSQFYFWQDSTTSGTALQFLSDNFTLTPKYQYAFSFMPEVTIYELTTKN